MTSDKILMILKMNLLEINPYSSSEKITRESMLSPLGLNSVGRAELIEKTLENVNLKIKTRNEFHTANNLGELSVMIYEKLINNS